MAPTPWHSTWRVSSGWQAFFNHQVVNVRRFRKDATKPVDQSMTTVPEYAFWSGRNTTAIKNDDKVVTAGYESSISRSDSQEGLALWPDFEGLFYEKVTLQQLGCRYDRTDCLTVWIVLMALMANSVCMIVYTCTHFNIRHLPKLEYSDIKCTSVEWSDGYADVPNQLTRLLPLRGSRCKKTICMMAS